MEWLSLVLVVGLLFGAGYWSRSKDIEYWNNGICSESGEPWVLVGDSEAGRHYCDQSGNSLWMTWYYP